MKILRIYLLILFLPISLKCSNNSSTKNVFRNDGGLFKDSLNSYNSNQIDFDEKEISSTINFKDDYEGLKAVRQEIEYYEEKITGYSKDVKERLKNDYQIANTKIKQKSDLQNKINTKQQNIEKLQRQLITLQKPVFNEIEPQKVPEIDKKINENDYYSSNSILKRIQKSSIYNFICKKLEIKTQKKLYEEEIANQARLRNSYTEAIKGFKKKFKDHTKSFENYNKLKISKTKEIKTEQKELIQKKNSVNSIGVNLTSQDLDGMYKHNLKEVENKVKDRNNEISKLNELLQNKLDFISGKQTIESGIRKIKFQNKQGNDKKHIEEDGWDIIENKDSKLKIKRLIANSKNWEKVEFFNREELEKLKILERICENKNILEQKLKINTFKSNNTTLKELIKSLYTRKEKVIKGTSEKDEQIKFYGRYLKNNVEAIEINNFKNKFSKKDCFFTEENIGSMLKSSKSESVEDIDILCYKEKLKKLNCRELDYYTWNVINLTNKSGIIPLSQREQETLEEVLSSKLGKKVEKIKEIENFVDELKRQNKNLESKEVEIKTILKETDINTFENDFDKYKETDKRIIYIMEEDLKSKSDSNDALTHVYTIYVNFKSKIIYSIDSNEDQIFFTDWINSEEKFKENIKDFVFIENVVKQQGFYTCYLHAIETATYIAQNLFLVDKFLKQINLYHDKKEDEKSVSYLADPAYDDEIKQKFKLHIFNETLPIGLEQSLVSTGKMHKILQNDPSKMAQYRKSIDRSINKISKNDLKNDILKRNPGYLRISTRHKMDKKGIQFCSKMNFERLCWIYRLYSKEVMENDSYKKIKIPVMYDDIFKSSFLPLATV